VGLFKFVFKSNTHNAHFIYRPTRVPARIWSV